MGVWNKRAARRAARQELLQTIQAYPTAGYGLFHLLDDAGLLAEEDKSALAPLMERIACRLDLDADDLEITLPLACEPITDAEHDTLTAVLGRLLRTFASDFSTLPPDRRLPALYGLNEVLHRHVEHTASILNEVDIESLLWPILAHCADALPAQTTRQDPAQPGDFFRATRLKRSDRYFDEQFLLKRRLRRHEITLVVKPRTLQILFVERLCPTLALNATRTVVHVDEGRLYRLDSAYRGAVHRLIELFREHVEDRSADPLTYQPLASGPEDVEK